MRYSLYALSIATSVPILLVIAGFAGAPPGNPALVPGHSIGSVTAVPPRIHDLLSRACYNCHTNETKWPWYASLPVAYQLVRKDVEAGRAAMNLSEWTTGAGRTPGLGVGMLTAACAAVEQHLMPKPNYLYLHPEARLTPEEVKSFCAWTREKTVELRLSARAARGSKK